MLTPDVRVTALFETKHKRFGLSIADRIDASGDCWLWTGWTNIKGYGGAVIHGKQRLVHNIMWETLVGPLPPGLQIDHLCRNPPCCNPDHLEPVTPKENSRRGQAGRNNRVKTQCPQGHPYSGDNVRERTDGYGQGRRCVACVHIWAKTSQRRRRMRLDTDDG